jgi:hypothetical protein
VNRVTLGPGRERGLVFVRGESAIRGESQRLSRQASNTERKHKAATMQLE